MLKRRRFKQTRTLHQRLADEAAQLREQARALAPGHRRETLLRREVWQLGRKIGLLKQVNALSHNLIGMRKPQA